MATIHTSFIVCTDVYGVQHQVTKYNWLVTATDKMLSGWGRATGKISKRIVICESAQQARRVAENMRQQGFIYVNTHTGNGRRNRPFFPYYNPSRYVVSINHVKDCPIWDK
jgi:hypothetical protein